MAEITLANSKRVALIDGADLPLVRQHRWYLHKDDSRVYVRCRTGVGDGRVIVLMHRLVMTAPRGMYVDHINGNGLDNRRVNLRICTCSQNLMNRGAVRTSATGLKGVTLCPTPRGNKYRAQGMLQRKVVHLGTHSTALAAHRAYCAWARKAHGEFFRAA